MAAINNTSNPIGRKWKHVSGHRRWVKNDEEKEQSHQLIDTRNIM